MGEPATLYGRTDEHRGSDLDLVPQMVMPIAEMKRRLEELQKFVKDVMVEGVDYGPPFPGSDKKVLLKPGAEKLAEIYGYTVEPRIVQRLEIWDPPHGPFFHYEIEALVYSKRSGQLVGKGVGSCNTKENRYRWRAAGRVCPECRKEGTVIRGKAEYGGGWLCFGKKGGCGAKWKAGDPVIEDQEVGRVENDDIHTLVNTVLKIGKKRAYVDAVISVTQSSGLFTGEDDDDDIDAGADDRKRTPKSSGARRDPGPGNQSKPGNGAHSKGGDDRHQTEVTIRGQKYWTAGVTAMKLLQVWDLARAYDGTKGKDAHKALLKEVMQVESSLDLNEAMADQFLEAMRTRLDEPGDNKTAGAGGTPY